MNHPLRDMKTIAQMPSTYINQIGQVFAVFGEGTQDSGNISYGVQVDQQRYFIKTAGDPADRRPFLPYEQRVAWLRNAIRLRCSCDHPTLPQLHNVIESPYGPLLVYTWVEGEGLGVHQVERYKPQSSFQRFRSLPAPEIVKALDLIFNLHHELAQRGWIAVDFYDGSLIYDFVRREIHIVDLDMYRDSPFINDMGRMFGSERFMAPEEFEQGALIDQQTNVFTMGRTALVLLADGRLAPSTFRGSEAQYEVVSRACRESRPERFDSMAEFYAAWCEAS